MSGIFETTQCLGLASRRAARRITGEFDRALRPHGPRATQFILLATLQLAGPRSIGELAELLGVDRTTMTRNLSVAAASRWVSVQPDASDGRLRVAEITDLGGSVLLGALPSWRSTQQLLTELIGAQTASSLRQLAGGPCVRQAEPDLLASYTGLPPMSIRALAVRRNHTSTECACFFNSTVTAPTTGS